MRSLSQKRKKVVKRKSTDYWNYAKIGDDRTEMERALELHREHVEAHRRAVMEQHLRQQQEAYGYDLVRRLFGDPMPVKTKTLKLCEIEDLNEDKNNNKKD